MDPLAVRERETTRLEKLMFLKSEIARLKAAGRLAEAANAATAARIMEWKLATEPHRPQAE